MGMIPKPETERDLALIEDYNKTNEKGWVYSIPQLGLKYARSEDGVLKPLTATRIHQILNKHGIPKNRTKSFK